MLQIQGRQAIGLGVVTVTLMATGCRSEQPEEVPPVSAKASNLFLSSFAGNDNVIPVAKRRDFTYCVSDAFTPAAFRTGVMEGLAAAMRDWSSATNITFRHVPAEDSSCALGDPGVSLNVWFDPMVAAGQAGAAYPHQVVMDSQDTRVGPPPPPPPGGPPHDLRVYYTRLLRHELGHTLGFHHEFNRSDGPCPDPAAAGRPIGPYDPESANHYVRPQNCSGPAGQTYVTDLDREGAQSVYGIPWESLGGQIVGNPAVASWGVGRLDVVALGTDGWLHHAKFDGQWHAFVPISGPFTSPPAAVVRKGTQTIDVVVRGADGVQLMHGQYNGTWQPFVARGGGLADGSPAVTSWASNRLDIFVRGTDNQLHHKWLDGTTWHEWEAIGVPPAGALTAGVAAVSWGPNRIDVFARGPNQELYSVWYNGGWQPWAHIGSPNGAGVAAVAPAVASWSEGHLELFAKSTNGDLYSLRYANGWASTFRWLGGEPASGPGVVNWKPGRSDLFVHRSDGSLGHSFFENSVWRSNCLAGVSCGLLEPDDELDATIRVDSEWNNGYCATVRLKNNDTKPIKSWEVVFDARNSQLTSSWNAVMTQSGTVRTAHSPSWTLTNPIPVGGISEDFGFCATKTGSDYLPMIISDLEFNYHGLEAESGSRTAPMVAASDGTASGGSYIWVSSGSNSNDTPPANGRATFTFTTLSPRKYRIWGRVIAPTTGKDSFWVRIDGGAWIKWNEIPLGSNWHWARVHDNGQAGNPSVEVTLQNGQHTLDIAYREVGTKLDNLLITDDLSFTPTAASGQP